MGTIRGAPELLPGVSIICCTNRERFIQNLFHNFKRQRHPKKELIIIVNDDQINLSPYQKLARQHGNVQVYRLPGRYSLGACLNFAVGKTKSPYIAKFDDDDYYAPSYLTESIRAITRAKADIIGKRAHYMYLVGSRTLLLRFPNDEHKLVSVLPGATLFFHRKVFSKVQFPNQNVGEDDSFCLRSIKKGYKVYSAGKENFVAIRRKNSSGHTWVIRDEKLIAHHKTIKNVQEYQKTVSRLPKELIR